MPINEDDVVLVTGASGFIASWIVAKLLKLGCKVRGTVRDPGNEKKCKFLRELPGAKGKLELVALDLNDDDSKFGPILEGVTLVLHTASPFPQVAPDHEDDLIKPAVNGTVGILKAALKVKTIRMVVVTSSAAAVGEGASVANEAQKARDESNWTDTTKAIAYAKSKTLAERAAWDLWNDNGRPWPLCTINPTLVQGPFLNASDAVTSAALCTRFLNGTLPLAPHISFGVVDVRDVAQAHIAALEGDPAIVTGRRFILHNRTLWLVEIAAYLGKTFEPLGYRMPKLEAPYPLLWIASFFDKNVALLLDAVGSFTEFDTTPSKEILKIEYMDLYKTLADTGHSLVHFGLVPKSGQYHLPRPDWTPLNSD
jgi:nucleoside-diphosphate-sugar epimerase